MAGTRFRAATPAFAGQHEPKEKHMRTLHLTILAAVVAAVCAAIPRATRAAVDWRAQTYCPVAVSSGTSIPLDTRLFAMDESDPCKILGTLMIVR